MRRMRFAVATPPRVGEEIALDKLAHHHATRVLRLSVGDAVELICGDGMNYLGSICASDKQATIVHIESAKQSECCPTLNIHLYLALLKGDAMDRSLQKAVELGVSHITPLITERSERKITADKKAKKYQHWQGILQASALQCWRAEYPVLHEIRQLDKNLSAECDKNWILSPHHGDKNCRSEAEDKVQSLSLVIGPEGGLSTQEVDILLANGWSAQQLGKRILRADTAVMVALTKAQLCYGDIH